MLEIIVVALFIWLSIKFVALSLRIVWGATQIIGLFLFMLALPALVGCLLFAGGIILLLPVMLLASACGILKLGA